MRLTKAVVAKLKPEADKADTIYFDEELRGFGLRIRASGRRVWIVQYRQGTKQRRLVLGDAAGLDADMARGAAKEKLAAVTLSADPQADKVAERAKATNTLGKVVELYLTAKESELRPTTCKEVRRYLRKVWKPLHGTPVHLIKRRDVALHLTKLTTVRGQTTAARARAHLSAVFAWMLREGIGDDDAINPVIGTNKPKEADPRDRVLTDDELREIWAACRDDDFGRIVKLLMLTACRRDEIGGLRWDEVNDRGEIVLPGERTKNGEPHELPLPGLVLEVLAQCPRRADAEHVFGHGDHGFNGFGKAKLMLDKRIVATRAKATGKAEPMARWTLHDLRRTAATVMAESPPDKENPKARGLGVLPHIVEAVLNHISGHKRGIAGVYNKAKYKPQVRAALALWADHIRSIVDGSERKIISMRQKEVPA